MLLKLNVGAGRNLLKFVLLKLNVGAGRNLLKFVLLKLNVGYIFSIYVFCGEATKKTSIDGLKWRDLVMGRWWLVNFKVSGVTKGFMC